MPSLLRAQTPDDDLHGSMPTGPLPSGDSPPGVMTTGAVPVVSQPVADASTAVSAAQTLLQTVVVGLAALLVGLVVFTTVRAVAGNDDPVLADPEEREDGLPTIDPGPGDPGRSEGDLADGRGTAAIDGDRDDGDRSAEQGTDESAGRPDDDSGSNDEDPDGPTSTSGPLESLSSPTGVDGGRRAPSIPPDPAGPSTTASTSPTLLPSRPIIVAPQATAPTSGGDTTTTGSSATTADPSSTTRSTTTSPPSTTGTSTTRPTTTDPPTPSVQIAAPAAGAQLQLGRTIRLSARAIPGADRYCWTLTQGSISTGPVCGNGPTRTFNRNDTTLDAFGPGAVTVRLVVEQSGTELGRQSIDATLTN